MAEKLSVTQFPRDGQTPSRQQQPRMVVSLSVPAVLAQLSTTIMQYIDAAMVGSLGANASASIDLVSSSSWLLGGAGPGPPGLGWPGASPASPFCWAWR